MAEMHNSVIQSHVKHWVTVLFHTEQLQGEGKAIPLEAWRGPEGTRRLRLPDCKTVGT
jgi:hypothetical protein